MTTLMAPHLPIDISLRTLDATTQDRVTRLLEGADSTADIDARRDLHAEAADRLGIQLPASKELALCTCGACYCDLVFDAWLAGTYLDGSVERVQCPGCLDDHRQTGD